MDNPVQADFIILSTCGTVDVVSEKSIQLIKEFQKYNGEIIVVGCLPDTDYDLMKKVFHGRFVRNVELNRLDEIFNPEIPYSEFENIQFEISNNEIDIEVCRGCVERCAYCAINRAIGPIQSLEIEECKQIVQKAMEQNVKRIIIGGDNVGVYGYD